MSPNIVLPNILGILLRGSYDAVMPARYDVFPHALDPVAPSGEGVLNYDRRHLLTYAELLDAADAGIDWEAGALAILGFDPATDSDGARACWDSHLARARWITGKGLAAAISEFREQANAEMRHLRQ